MRYLVRSSRGGDWEQAKFRKDEDVTEQCEVPFFVSSIIYERC